MHYSWNSPLRWQLKHIIIGYPSCLSNLFSHRPVGRCASARGRIVHTEETYSARAFNSLRHEENLVTVWQELNTAPTHYRVNNGGKERRAFRDEGLSLDIKHQFSLSQAYSSLEKEIKRKERRREINLVTTDMKLAGKQSDDKISLEANGPARKPHCKNVNFRSFKTLPSLQEKKWLWDDMYFAIKLCS